MIEENEALLRTEESYEKFAETKTFEETGIKEKCIFNKINNFHITRNKSGDVMHDVPEGVIPYSLSKSLEGLINDKIISLEMINNRIQSFEYNDLEKSNKPRLLYYSNSKKGGRKLKIKQSASEMLCLARYLGLMIGDLIPADNPYWKVYLCLRQIIDILMSPIVDKGQIQNVKALIMKYNKQYLKLFGKLKPKMHIWLHHPSLTLSNGPVIHYSSMKFERKNKELKEIAIGTASNVHLPLTIAIRHQLKLCYKIESCPPIHGDILLGPIDNYNARSYLETKIPNLSKNIPAMTLKNVEIVGNTFCAGTVIVTRITEEGPQFGIIKNIFYCNNVYFEIEEFETICFNHHFHAYEVQFSLNKPKSLINIDFTPRTSPCLLCIKKNSQFIATRYSL